MKDQPANAALIEQALQIALEAHKGQKDHSGQPYITHPLRVMARINKERQQIVAILHDVVEDSKITLDELRRRGIPDDMVAAVDALTKRKGESYEAQLERARANPLAREVKLADLQDNMDIRRRAPLDANDLEKLNKYYDGWIWLTGG